MEYPYARAGVIQQLFEPLGRVSHASLLVAPGLRCTWNGTRLGRWRLPAGHPGWPTRLGQRPLSGPASRPDQRTCICP
eukprot:9522739-Lingulodinium_polyedra.AAC.1